jgi:hypothetical protein
MKTFSLPSAATIAAVHKLLAANPDLSIQGWSRAGIYTKKSSPNSDGFARHRAELYTTESVQQILTAVEFCRHVIIHPKVNSYVVKHAMERWGKEHGMESYISNGCGIAGAMVYGYSAVRIPNSLNCTLSDRR